MATNLQRAVAAQYDVYQELQIAHAQNVRVSDPQRIDVERNSPLLGLVTHGAILALQGRFYEELSRPLATYPLAKAMSLRRILMTHSKNVRLDGNLMLNSTWVPIEMQFDHSQDVVMRNQRYDTLHLHLVNASSVRFENVVCDHVHIRFSGNAGSIVKGLRIRRTLRLWSQVPGSSVSQLVLEPTANVTHDGDSPTRVDISAVSSTQQQQTQQPPANPFAAVFPYYIAALQHTVQPPPSVSSSNFFPPVPSFVASHSMMLSSPPPQRRSSASPLVAPVPRAAPRPAQFPVRKALPGENVCSICQENYANSMTSCNHQAFCAECLEEARVRLQRRPGRANEGAPCPICNAPISAATAFEAPPTEGDGQEFHKQPPASPGSPSPKPIRCGGAD